MTLTAKQAAIAACLLAATAATAQPPVSDRPLQEKWAPSEFGAGDRAGAVARTTPALVLKAVGLVKKGRTATLGKLYASDIPAFGARSFTLVIPGTPTGGPMGDGAMVYHDEYVAAELGQIGTQFDGPGHIGVRTSKGDFFYNGRFAHETYERGAGGRVVGLGDLGVEHVAEKGFVCRGVLLDAAAYRGIKRLPVPREAGSPGIVTAGDVQAMVKRQGLAEIGEGDCVFLYTGHGDLWRNAEWRSLPAAEKAKRRSEFSSGEPGLGVSACRYLAERRVILTGGDTGGTEAGPVGEREGAASSCHVEMQTRRGIWNIENLDFSPLLAERVHEFLFVWAPLKLVGASGSPGNPVALWCRPPSARGHPRPLGLGGRPGRGRGRGRLGPQVPVVPGQIALIPVLHVARRLDAVVLARVDDQLGRHPHPPQRLVELFRGEQGHVHVVLADHHQRRRLDLVDAEERRELDPQLRVLPGQAELLLPLVLVVVGAVAGQMVGHARPRHGGLEALRLRDHHVGEDAAVAPPPDAQPFGIGGAGGHRVVHRRHHVLVVLVAPAGPDGAAEGGAVAGGAARVRGDHQVAVRGQHLPLQLEGGRVLSGRSAVDAQDGRPLAQRRARRVGQEAVHHRAVRAPGLEALDAAQLDAGEEGVVGVRERAQRAAVHRPHLGWTAGLALDDRDRSRARHVEGGHVALAGHHPLDRPARGRHAREVAVAPVLDQEEQSRAVRGEARVRHVPVERRGQRARRAAAGSDHRDVAGRVPHVVGVAFVDVGDPLAVRAPGRRAVGARVRRDRPRRRASFGRHHEHVGVLARVRVLAAVAGESDPAPVGRPRRLAVVVGAGGELARRARVEIEHVDMGPQVGQVTLAVALELAAPDHDRGRGLVVVVVVVAVVLADLLLRLRLAGIGVPHHQRQSPPVRRPREVRHA